MKLESQGYFAVRSLSSDPRWRNGSIYLFGLDTHGNPLFSGGPSTGMTQRKVVFVKRVVVYGLPILVGSGYYLDEGPQVSRPCPRLSHPPSVQ